MPDHSTEVLQTRGLSVKEGHSLVFGTPKLLRALRSPNSLPLLLLNFLSCHFEPVSASFFWFFSVWHIQEQSMEFLVLRQLNNNRTEPEWPNL